MLDRGLPKVIVLAMVLLSITEGLYAGPADIDSLELFAGDRAVTRGLRRCPSETIQWTVPLLTWRTHVASHSQRTLTAHYPDNL